TERHREEGLVREDPVLANEPAATPPTARPGPGNDIQTDPLDQDSVPLFVDLRGDKVGLAVAHGDERVLAVLHRVRAPPSRLRLHEKGFLSRVRVGEGDRV